ncbi:MFS transporter [Acetobacteraceae bacterium H6797]|nr:MFS transporter [Acetobacteraceae bacterium H6797]
MNVAARYGLLLTAVFLAVGVSLPFMPSYLASGGLLASQVSLVLFAGQAVRLLVAPLGGQWADRLGDARWLFTGCAAASAVMACFYPLAGGFGALLLVHMAYYAVMAPVVPLTEGMTVLGAKQGLFDYGRVRSIGSIAFIVGAVGGGWLIDRMGIGAVPWLLVLCLLASALAIHGLPRGTRPPGGAKAGLRPVLALPGFRRVLLISGCIQGSHALYYAFGTIHWTQAGIEGGVIGLLWATGVIAEIMLFFVAQPLLARLRPLGMILLGAAGGLLRWGILAQTIWLPALFLAQAMHALTFAAAHVAAMQLLAQLVPARYAATAQTLHSSLGLGVAQGGLLLAAGPLYTAFGAHSFWAMAGLCLAGAAVALWPGRPAAMTGRLGA